MLAAGPGGDYGVHSEMFTAGLMQLHRAGKVTNKHKGVFDGVSVATFAMGPQEREMHGNAAGDEKRELRPGKLVGRVPCDFAEPYRAVLIALDEQPVDFDQQQQRLAVG